MQKIKFVPDEFIKSAGPSDKFQKILLKKSATSQVDFYRGKAGTSLPPHNHPESDQILHHVRGAGELILEEESFSLEVGAVYFIDRGVEHSLTSNSDDFEAIVFTAPPLG